MAYPELNNLICDLLASNRGPGYGVSVLDAASDLSVIDVELRFIAGRTYCCAEPFCHLPRDNRRLQSLAVQRAINLPEAVTVRWHCHVEQGAKLECMKKIGLPMESEAYDFQVDFGGTAAG